MTSTLKLISPFVIVFFLIINLAAQPQMDIMQLATGFDEPVDIAHAGDDRLFYRRT